MSKRTFAILGASLVSALCFVQMGQSAAPPGRYVINAGTVVDKRTKLTWEQMPASTPLALTGAQAYCAVLTLGGLAWRLPTLKELATLVDVSVAPPGPTLDSTAFPTASATFTWSATPSVDTPGNTWGLDFSTATPGNDSPSQLHAYRCVH
jgi:Protein of unknown function (DUF1566)